MRRNGIDCLSSSQGEYIQIPKFSLISMNIKCISPYIHQVLFETNFWEPAEKLYVMDTLESRRAWVPRDDGAYESAADLPH